MLTISSCLVILAAFASAAPASLNVDHPAQSPFEHKGPIDPLKHLSAISPFYIPTQSPTPLPDQCSLTRVSLLIRHSSIQGNDDEFEETMSPFIQKIQRLQKDKKTKHLLPSKGEWAFLRKWDTPIVEKTLEEISERGKNDARMLGKFFRKQYHTLMPSPDKHPKGKNATKDTYKVWTASSPRDIDTAKNYILGSFPSHQAGGGGKGDGDTVQLVEVPNKDKNWDRSLTPHVSLPVIKKLPGARGPVAIICLAHKLGADRQKACDTFDKKPSLEPAIKWLSVYAPRIRDRLSSEIHDLAFMLNDQDILAMAMLCGYETISSGKSHFCHVFTDDEWRDHEYYFDIRFHYMMGYGSPLATYLGAPWVRDAMHLLGGKEGDGDGDHPLPHGLLKGGKSKLPTPKLPPNATHTQLLFPHFTHRESPAFVATFLNLLNDTSIPHPASEEPALDHRPTNRQWRTSHLVSFLGHIALERFGCEDDGDYVRALVNGKQYKMGGCTDGLNESCKWDTFNTWVEERVVRWGDWAGVCEKKD